MAYNKDLGVNFGDAFIRMIYENDPIFQVGWMSTDTENRLAIAALAGISYANELGDNKEEVIASICKALNADEMLVECVLDGEPLDLQTARIIASIDIYGWQEYEASF